MKRRIRLPEYNILAKLSRTTVVSEYKNLQERPKNHQTEAELEAEFIELLKKQSYDYLSIKNENDLILNLRKQLEILNNYNFSDSEWDQLFRIIANPNSGIVEKTRLIQEDYRQNIKLDNGSSKNINLIDKNNIHNNRLQVINQYCAEGIRKNRYDVTILVNGIPIVHVELKQRGVKLKEAFNQINRYQRESFWTGSGLFEFIQIFIISNGTNTKYYSNTTRNNHVKEQERKVKKERSSHSFKFTNFWADAKNNKILDLIDFTRTFLSKHTILNVLTKYCIFTSENMLLVMRPYQIVATEKIINKIEISTNYKKYGTIDGGGYIWHATGSGKTLTSFKTARIASEIPYIDKVLFVVDRKDLDYQTMREYDRFEKGAANSSVSTEILKRQLEDSGSKIIITTIQKLSIFSEKNQNPDIFKKHIVFIFDECHRSQFGKMHQIIIKKFKKYHLFGFTGTPIFASNSSEISGTIYKTTEQLFGEKLHAYTVVNAIDDANVLPFKIAYINTIKAKSEIKDKDVSDIDMEKAYEDPKRIKLVTSYILEHFDQYTYRNRQNFDYSVVSNINDVVAKNKIINEITNKKNISGFNSILAVSSIKLAKLYYQEFKEQMFQNPSKKIKIALIYSFGANEELDGIIDDENNFDTSGLDKNSKDFLDDAIKDYNEMFKTNYDTSSDKFQNYYKDISLRVKNKEIDMLIVVNMFLTGFDATTLNTLWVDKKLKSHGLIQAFSRTNRILNSVKKFGNIVCFRNLAENVDKAIGLFADKDARGIIIIRSFDEYFNGYKDKNGKSVIGYKDLVNNLIENFPLSLQRYIGEEKQRNFIKLFGAILKLRNILLSFDEFNANELLSERDFQDYCGRYQDLRDEWIDNQKNKPEYINDDLVFEIELIAQAQVDIDYILALIRKYHEHNSKDLEPFLARIEKAISSSPELRSKKDLILKFVEGLDDVTDVISEWKNYVTDEAVRTLANIIIDNNLNDEETKTFIFNCFDAGEIKTTGTDIDKILPPISRFSNGGIDRIKKKEHILEVLTDFFNKFFLIYTPEEISNKIEDKDLSQLMNND